MNAVNIFKGDDEIQQQIIPIMLEKVGSYGEDMQVEAGNTFYELIDQKVSLKIQERDITN